MKPFHLRIASVGESHFDGDAQSANFPGVDGEFTILAHHEPLVATLKKGDICIRDAEGHIHTFAVESGIVEISGNQTIVLI